jgi:hypothetical protein
LQVNLDFLTIDKVWCDFSLFVIKFLIFLFKKTYERPSRNHQTIRRNHQKFRPINQ